MAIWSSWLLVVCLLSTGSLRAEQSLSLAWTASPDARTKGYVVLYGNASGAYTQSSDVGNVTETTLTGLTEGQTYYVTLFGYGDAALRSDFSNEVFYQIPPAASVVSRMVFYNASAWDGSDPAANASDDAAIPTDKIALLPGQIATFSNYTSYNRGLNGIMVDISNLGRTVSASDFDFHAGNDNTPAAWLVAFAPSVSVRHGAGVSGSDRITLIWPDQVIQGQWLQVTVRATPNTRLRSPDVFYFGNAIGESGDSTRDAAVTRTDVLQVLDHLNSLPPATITDPLDFNRDQQVTSADARIALNQSATGLPALQLIDLSNTTAITPSALGSASGTPSPGVQPAAPSNAPRNLSPEPPLTILTVNTLADRSIQVFLSCSGTDPVRIWSSTNLWPSHWQELPADSVNIMGNGFYELRMPLTEAGSGSFFRLEPNRATE